jgi:hypothetical protein
MVKIAEILGRSGRSEGQNEPLNAQQMFRTGKIAVIGI